MKVPKVLWAGVFALTLVTLAACVQPGEFRSFQGEIRREIAAQDQQIQGLSRQITALQGRLDKYMSTRDTGGEQFANHLNEFVLLQQEVAKLRGDVETIGRMGPGGLGDLRRTQEELVMQVQELQQRMGPTAVSPAPPTVATAPTTPTEPADRKEDLYKEARFNFESGEYAQARGRFQELLKSKPDSALASSAQFWIGECFFREGNYKQAILEYEKVISQYPQSTKIPSALLKQGMAFEKLEDMESARFLYREITKEYANSDQARIAQHRLDRLP